MWKHVCGSSLAIAAIFPSFYKVFHTHFPAGTALISFHSVSFCSMKQKIDWSCKCKFQRLCVIIYLPPSKWSFLGMIYKFTNIHFVCIIQILFERQHNVVWIRIKTARKLLYWIPGEQQVNCFHALIAPTVRNYYDYMRERVFDFHAI